MKKVILVIAVLMVAIMLTTLFVGCSAEDYKKKFEKDGYTVTAVENDGEASKIALAAAAGSLKTLGINIEGNLEYIVVGYKDDSVVAVIKFENSKDASNLRKELKAEKDENAKVGGTGKVVKLTVSK